MHKYENKRLRDDYSIKKIVNVGSGDGLLPDGTKPSSKPFLSKYQ